MNIQPIQYPQTNFTAFIRKEGLLADDARHFPHRQEFRRHGAEGYPRPRRKEQRSGRRAFLDGVFRCCLCGRIVVWHSEPDVPGAEPV